MKIALLSQRFLFPARTPKWNQEVSWSSGRRLEDHLHSAGAGRGDPSARHPFLPGMRAGHRRQQRSGRFAGRYRSPFRTRAAPLRGSKSRRNVLERLRAGYGEDVINADALAYLRARAPSEPILARFASGFAHEDQTAERRQSDLDRERTAMPWRRRGHDAAAIPHIAAAIDRRVGIQDLAVITGFGHTDAIA